MSKVEVKEKKVGRPRLSERTHISREAVRQTQVNALRKLRRRLRNMGITSMSDLV